MIRILKKLFKETGRNLEFTALLIIKIFNYKLQKLVKSIFKL